MFYTLTSLNDTCGLAAGAYDSPPDTLRENEVECSKEVYDNYNSYSIVNGTIEKKSDLELLKLAQGKKKLAITKSCGLYISLGFMSSALGNPHTYPSNVIDQINISSNALTAIMNTSNIDFTINQMCADSSNVWSNKSHTSQQMQQVCLDMNNFINDTRVHSKLLCAQVDAFTTLTEVDAIVW